MATVLDVGQYIVERVPHVNNERPHVDKMKLFKLCFFSQAWHLAWAGKPLFREEMQAWKYGPVPPELRYRTEPVATGPRRWDIPVVPGGDSERLSSYEKEVVGSIVEFYGPISSTTLSQMTHLSAAWNEARRGLPETSSSAQPISLTTLRDECTQFLNSGNPAPKPPCDLPSFNLDELFSAAKEAENDWWTTFRLLATR